jgi:hypothetical protein
MPNIERSNQEPRSLGGDFAQIQTKVPPQNPYDQVPRPTEPDVNHSLDNVKHPIVNQKDPTHQDYLTTNQRLRSILKKK